MWSRVSLLDDALTPVVALERAVHGQTHGGYARQSSEAILDLAIERGQAVGGVAGACRIEVEHVAVGCIDAEVLVLQVGERFGHQDSSGQQHDGERSLKDDECLLGQC